jgi:subtilase family serine protease
MKVLSALWIVVLFSLIASGAPSEEKTLKGHVLPILTNLPPIGRVSSTTQLHLAIGLSLRNQQQLTELLQRLYDPRTLDFHHYLTPEEFTDQFGPTKSDHQAVKDFATTNGLTITKIHSNRLLLDVTGSAGDIERVFKVTMRVYKHPSESRTFYAPDVEPSVPANLVIADIGGLNNYSLPHPKDLQVMTPEQLAKAKPNAGSGIDGLYQGNDFRAAYAPGVSFTGSGQILGLLEFDGYNGRDITNYERIAGIRNVPLQNVLIDGFNGSAGVNNIEVALDIENAASMAPGLTEILVYEAPGGASQNDILNPMATDDLAKQISSSWGWSGGPQSTTDAIYQEMDAQGQEYFNAAGDTDAFPPDAVDDPTLPDSPSSNPYITQVGGTELTTTGPGGSWVSETVWNSGGGSGSSGGISGFYTIPSWQTGINMTTNQGSTMARNIPDVAMTAIGVSVVFTENGISTNIGVGGTSCAAPLWAGFTALINQQSAALGKPPVGFLNPAIYTIGEGTNYSSDFHDITTGNNFSSSSPTNFPAVPG